MPPKASRGFSFFGIGGLNPAEEKTSLDGSTNSNSSSNSKSEIVPTLRLQADKEVYRPGDSVSVSVEVYNPRFTCGDSGVCSFLIERLSFEIVGIEKLDTQWFATQKQGHGSKRRRGFDS
ncbi:hypothetical protein GIB67_018222 [Kingdonia uniflora]|uniref:Uncharacterized protein n=1 Tax=Kingdonia uniflora TaxID=39325 RepID=A0A7J7NN57_9MAGN|nr:hypothetical protein GIB67_018222 [Kingdonia uniflora]